MFKIKKKVLDIISSLFDSTRILSNEQLSPHFNLLTISGAKLKNVQWMPGQKIKLPIDKQDSRSYTPLSWDSKNGVMKTLIYMHGNGPGSKWAQHVQPLEHVEVHGPKSSLKLEPHMKHILFFGDETTFGLAHALKKYQTDLSYDFSFESTHLDESKIILEKLELEGSLQVSTSSLDVVVRFLHEKYLENNKPFIVLAGKQQSIVYVRRELQNRGVPADRIYKKVYWGWKDDPMGKLKE